MTSNFIRLTWNQNPDGDLAGYRVYMSQRENALTLYDDVALADLVNPSAPGITYWNLPSYGRWFIAITAYDTSNNESAMTAAVSKLIGSDDEMAGAAA